MTPPNDAARPACYITEELLADMVNQQRGTARVIAADRPRRGDNWVALYTAADYDALRVEVDMLRTQAEMNSKFITAMANEFHACGCVMGEGPKVVNARAEAAEALIANVKPHIQTAALTSNLRTMSESVLAAFAALNENGEGNG